MKTIDRKKERKKERKKGALKRVRLTKTVKSLSTRIEMLMGKKATFGT
jgi:hypothetical protein